VVNTGGEAKVSCSTAFRICLLGRVRYSWGTGADRENGRFWQREPAKKSMEKTRRVFRE
jgi:hypothetical protein